MSLYYEAASVLAAERSTSTLSVRIYNTKELKSKPAQLYALVSETVLWSSVLSDLVERTEILKLEKKVLPSLKIDGVTRSTDIYGSWSPSSLLPSLFF